MSVMEQEPVRTRRSFTDEFKRDAVALVIDEDRRIVDVAHGLGVGEGSSVGGLQRKGHPGDVREVPRQGFCAPVPGRARAVGRVVHEARAVFHYRAELEGATECLVVGDPRCVQRSPLLVHAL